MIPVLSLIKWQSVIGTIRAGFRFAKFICAAILLFNLAVEPIHAAGTVVGWGANDSFQSSAHPAMNNIAAVAGGATHSLALGNTGTVVGWGDNTQGEASSPANLTNAVAIAAGNGFSLALRTNGNVVSWGSQTTVPAGLTNVVAIAASLNNKLALASDGKVVAWGVVPPPPATVTNVVAIGAGNQHSLALIGDGTVVAWGDNTVGQTNIPAGLTNVVELAAGASNSLALQADGTVVAWGDNTWGQSTVPAGLANVVAIAAGARHCLALEQNGIVVAWGDNTYSQIIVPANATNVVGIAAGSYHSLAIIGNGSPVITVPPVSQYNASTGDAIFRVMAAGLAPLSYQWQQDGTNITDATNSVLVLTNLATSVAGAYSVTVTNSLGTVTSARVKLPPAWHRPVFLIQPQPQSVLCGDPATFQTAANGTLSLNYQWQVAGTNIPGATNLVLTLASVTGDDAGNYTVVVTNSSGAATSQVAVLTVIGQPPLITSPLTAAGKQGTPFSYAITGLHNPTAFQAAGLPNGLGVNTTNGLIQGTPLESGIFVVTLGTANLCASAQTNLTLTIASSLPVITSALTASGTEQAAFNYRIRATGLPTGFGAGNLPQGLSVNPATGIISGSPLYAGNYTVTISATNVWGVGTASLQLTISNALVTGLAIANVITNYSSPYLLNFQFSLRDNSDPTVGNAVVADPRFFSVIAFEDTNTVNPSETSVILQGVNQGVAAKVLKANLVLDFSESIASPTGALDSNGIPVAVDTEVSAAQSIVNLQPATAQFGVYEFHRDDQAPQQVQSLTTDKTLLDNAIAGIWTNYVQNFPAGSRCWDALVAAINKVGPTNNDEAHVVVFCSDGNDTSSTATFQNVINAATKANVQIYCVGFGDEIDTATLQSITTQTQGRYYEATNLTALANSFALIGKDLSGQYILRWATLKRSAKTFMPTFQITYQGLTAVSPANPPPVISGTNYLVDTNSVPPTTNTVFLYTTNYIIPPFLPTTFAGNVTVGSLRLVADAAVLPSAITMRATYVPRYIRQLRLHYLANWPCVVSLASTNPGEMLYGWSLTQTNDGAGGKWALLTSSNQQSLASSMPFAGFGPLLTFKFHDVLNASNAFSFFYVDNTIYTNNGNQSFGFENTNAFITVYPALPYGTPVPWLIQYGFTDSSAWSGLETNDLNGNGLMIWQDYLAGLNPTNASSVFTVRSLSPTGSPGHYQVTFSTALNRTYRVDTSTNLLTWQTLQDGITGTGGDVTVPDNRNLFGITRSYYRVAVH